MDLIDFPTVVVDNNASGLIKQEVYVARPGNRYIDICTGNALHQNDIINEMQENNIITL